jgi:adenylyltransferase/sulfurtransferase
MFRKLTQEQEIRYHKNILLPGIGIEGQSKLLQSAVLLVGAGGLGSASAYYLAATGIGRLGVVDADTVDLSNLQRQILYRTSDIGQLKVESARNSLVALNPDVKVEIVPERLTDNNAASLIAQYDLIVDCTDNFATRFLLNETCVHLQKPFIHGGVSVFAGQVTTIVPGVGPCLRCIFPRDLESELPTHEEGILGAVPGVIGAIQAAEAVKFLLGFGDLLIGRLLTYDALSMTFREIPLQRSPYCPSCSNL